MTNESFHALVIGAGPAGMAAAAELADGGASTLLVDEQAGPGGQIYRAIESAASDTGRWFGKSYVAGRRLAADLRARPIDYRPATTLINVTAGNAADLVCGSRLYRVDAPVMIIATGAYERPLPIPGWTMPGVMTAGAGQVLAKQSGAVPSGKLVLAGSGPLLWLLAWQYARMGVKVAAIIASGGPHARSKALRHAPGFLASRYVRDGFRYIQSAWRSTKIMRATRLIGVTGDDAATGIVAEIGGKARTIAADTVLLHNGIIPNVNLAGAIGCDLVWSFRHRCWQPKVDAWQRTSRDGIYVAGDGAGIDGARAAECSGRIAALDALTRLGRLSASERDRRAERWIGERRRWLTGRPFIDTLYPPIEIAPQATADPIVCRCEGVRLGAAREALEHGSGRLMHLKATTRCGMGPCQGRMCGPSIAQLQWNSGGMSAVLTETPSHRFPVKPLRLDALAACEADGTPDQAEIRE